MTDMTVSEFLQQHFAGPEYSRLRHSIVRMVEGYDAWLWRASSRYRANYAKKAAAPAQASGWL